MEGVVPVVVESDVIVANPGTKLSIELFWDLFPGTPAVDLDCR
jgi:hypothetical protein